MPDSKQTKLTNQAEIDTTASVRFLSRNYWMPVFRRLDPSQHVTTTRLVIVINLRVVSLLHVNELDSVETLGKYDKENK